MPATLTDLLTVRSAEDEEAALISVLKDAGFPVTDWEHGGAGQTMVKGISKVNADRGSLVSDIVAGGYVSLAKELADPTWLDLIAEQFFYLQRARATYTKQRIKVACQLGLGPQTINAGFIVRAKTSGNRYEYHGAPVSVPDNGQVFIEVQAESPGSTYRDPAYSITDIVTPLPGLSVVNEPTAFGGLVGSAARKNPANRGSGAVLPTGSPTLSRSVTVRVIATGVPGVGGTVEVSWMQGGTRFATLINPIPVSWTDGAMDGVTLGFSSGSGAGFITGDEHTFDTPGSPITANGVDDESQASLASRCLGRWPSLSLNVVPEKYVAWVRQVSLDNAFGIEKVTARPSALFAGQTDILVATATGAPAPSTVTAVQAYLNARDGITDTANVIAATNLDIEITGQIVVRQSEIDAVQARANELWQRYISDLPIGGDLSTGYPGSVRLAELIQVVMDAGAIDQEGIAINGASGNMPVGANEVAVIPAGQDPATAFEWITVA